MNRIITMRGRGGGRREDLILPVILRKKQIHTNMNSKQQAL